MSKECAVEMLGNHDSRNEDEDERQIIIQYLEDGCGCHLSCSARFSFDEIMKLRADNLEMTTQELDLFIKGQLRSSLNVSDAVAHSGEARQRPRNQFFYHANKVCQNTFLLINGISKSYYKNVCEHYKIHGVASRQHGNKGKLPVNAFSYEDVTQFKNFMDNYASNRAVTLPGRYPGYKDITCVLLPTEDTKVKIWNFYVDSCRQSGYPYMQYPTFCRKWRELASHIVMMKPRSDLCFTCQRNHNKIMDSSNTNIEEKLQLVEEQTHHLRKAATERSFYKLKCEESKEAVKKLSKEWKAGCANAPNSYDGSMHYSFDFAQQLHYPANPQQPGPIFFKTARKAGLFGICCEGIPRQINYIIDESVATGKGANTVISLLHSFFAKHGLGEKNAILHADNCSGQNKNNTVIRYLLWRIINGYHKSISLHFLIAGHTKFQVDACFGLIKKKTSITYISSLLDIAKCVLDSSKISGMNYPELAGLENGTVTIPVYDWKNYLEKYFNKVTLIKSKQHFRVSFTDIGVIHTKEYHGSEEFSQMLLKDLKILPKGLPDIVQPPGLPAVRKQYLYAEIRQFCKEESKDLVCPNM